MVVLCRCLFTLQLSRNIFFVGFALQKYVFFVEIVVFSYQFYYKWEIKVVNNYQSNMFYSLFGFGK
jgi:hypothetical protein